MLNAQWVLATLAALTATGCSKAPATTGTGTGGGGGITATGSGHTGSDKFAKPLPSSLALVASVSSASLADDCGAPAAPAAVPAAPITQPKAADAAQAPMAPGAGGQRNPTLARSKAAPGWTPPCQQTKMQLQLGVTGATGPTTIKVTKVELLDQAGALLGELTAREPARWTDASGFAAWDGQLQPSDALKVEYKLSAPAWDKIAGGRYGGATFQLRVTAEAIGADGTRAQAQPSLATSVAIEPHVVT